VYIVLPDDMTDAARTRREFLSAIGAISAVGLLPSEAWATTAPHVMNRSPIRMPRGLAAPEDFLFAPELVYLQTGSLGPTPRPVMERTIAAWKELELNPSFYGYGAHEHAMDDVRATAARFLGCKTEELVLTRCTTDGMNTVAQGLTFAPGDRVLTTDQEHPGGRHCWDYVARRFGAVLDIVPIPPGENDAQAIVDRFAKAITPRTRVLSFSHLLSSTGLRMPVAQLSALARSRDCLAVVDGAQAVGGIPVDVKALGCHVYATSGHKWLLGPKGTGLLYLSEEIGDRVDVVSTAPNHAVYGDGTGVTSIPSVLGLGAAVEYLSTMGIDRVEAHNLALRNRLFAALQEVPKVRVMSAASGPLASALVTFTLPADVESRAFQQMMRGKNNIELKMVPKNWMNGIRVSTHLFNTEQDVDSLIAALKSELS
jgi:selenocysteine lyase/cysteine desulfurase